MDHAVAQLADRTLAIGVFYGFNSWLTSTISGRSSGER
jgi:hypothetical protein